MRPGSVYARGHGTPRFGLLTPAGLGYSLASASTRGAMTNNPSDERDEGAEPTRPVRQRVIKHLRGLIVPGAFGLTACKSCVVCDPMPPPQDAGTATGATHPASTFTPPVVCDPMPPPPDAGPAPDDSVAPPPQRRFATPPPGASAAPPGSMTRTPPRRTPDTRPPVVCDPMPPPAPTPKK